MFKDSRIEALFPTSLWIYQLENHEALNQDLKSAIYDMLNKGLGKYQAAPHSVWQSEGSIQKREDFRQLVNRIEGGLSQTLNFLEIKSNRAQISGMWANIYGQSNSIDDHTHPNNFLSGVYYVEAPENCGGISFKDPRPQAHVFQPVVESYNPFNIDFAGFKAVEGALYIFPSWLEHRVAANSSGADRISIAFNAVLEGDVGDPDRFNFAPQ